MDDVIAHPFFTKNARKLARDFGDGFVQRAGIGVVRQPVDHPDDFLVVGAVVAPLVRVKQLRLVIADVLESDAFCAGFQKGDVDRHFFR